MTTELAFRYGEAFGRMVDGTVVVGWDSRPGGDELVAAVSAGLSARGVRVLDAGVVPTPTVGLVVRERGLAGGVVVTASHNPEEYNGLKFFSARGVFLEGGEVDELFSLADGAGASRPAVGAHAEPVTDAIDEHIRLVLSSSLVDAEAVARVHPLVVVDCVNGAGSVILPRLLRELGCDVVELHCDAGAGFPRGAEPTPEHLGELSRAVVEARAHVGLACDPDADRLAVVDERGVAVGEEMTLALSVRIALAATRGPVVCNVSTSRMIDDVAAEFGVVSHRTPIGEINVVSKMLEVGAVIGGEGNGGVILPEVHPGRDAATAAGLVVTGMAAGGGVPVSELVGRFTAYASVKRKLTLDSPTRDGIVEAMKAAFPDGELDLTDGAKMAWPDGWVHARMSGTEPVVRVIAEATRPEFANELADRAVSAVSGTAEGATPCAG